MANAVFEEPCFTYADYRGWQGDERWELIEGEAFLMSPAPSWPHQRLLVALAGQIYATLEGKTCQLAVAPFDVRLPRSDEADDQIDTVLQPDLAVICDPTKLDRAGCRGAPDFVIEILSPATSVRDQIAKRDIYERHGVRELWLVDPDTRALTLYRLDQAKRRFVRAQDSRAEGRTRSEAVPGLEMCLRLRNQTLISAGL
jgi:Uma2 family endonuclease